MTISNMLGRLYFQNTINVCVADGMYLIEQAGVIIDWIIACNCLNYTI